MIHEILQPVHAVADQALLNAVARVESRNGVRPEDIELTIRASAGDIVLRPQPDGELRLPVDLALLAENPMVTSNQPRGSLDLSVDLALMLDSDELQAATLLEALDAAQRVLDQQPGSSQQVAGVEFLFAEQATLTLPSAVGETLLISGRERRIIVPRESLSAAHGGRLTPSHVPLLILPYVRGTPAQP